MRTYGRNCNFFPAEDSPRTFDPSFPRVDVPTGTDDIITAPFGLWLPLLAATSHFSFSFSAAVVTVARVDICRSIVSVCIYRVVSNVTKVSLLSP